METWRLLTCPLSRTSDAVTNYADINIGGKTSLPSANHIRGLQYPFTINWHNFKPHLSLKSNNKKSMKSGRIIQQGKPNKQEGRARQSAKSFVRKENIPNRKDKLIKLLKKNIAFHSQLTSLNCKEPVLPKDRFSVLALSQ